jgi:3-oxoacyl-[acyl-carrier protein] reductase
MTSAMTRASLTVLSRALVEEYAHDGVASFVLSLGFVDTPLLRNMALNRNFDAPDPEAESEGRPWQARYQEWAGTIPAGRIGTPEELGALAAFLTSPAAEYLNGSVLDFAGGLAGGSL